MVGNWSAWSACSQFCGPGVKTRSRTLTEPMYGGAECPEGDLEEEPCEEQPCPIHCELSECIDR